MTGRILVVEPDPDSPDPDSRASLAGALHREGHEVEHTGHGARAVERLRGAPLDLLIVEPAAPGMCGLEGCRRIRAESDIPLVIVSSRDSEVDRVLGLEAGADDYVGKPFSAAELLSRVRAILRRRHLDRRGPDPVRRVGDLQLDLVAHRVLVAGRSVSVTPTEFRLLAFLAAEPGRPFTPQEILRHLWRSEHVGRASACKAHVANLRGKIETQPARPRRLVTVRGAGYSVMP
jgi:DNA-binding response OmpR family regulator